jgi:hypothetical protein
MEIYVNLSCPKQGDSEFFDKFGSIAVATIAVRNNEHRPDHQRNIPSVPLGRTEFERGVSGQNAFREFLPAQA